MARRYRRKKKLPILYILIAAIVALAACLMPYFKGKDKGTPPPEDAGQLLVHFIDVGQGDAIYIEVPEGDNMLIDAGPGSAEDELITYLDGIGVKEIDYLVLTHPDEDHIGGADLVFAEYTVNTVLLPDCEKDTKAYENMINGIEAEDGCERIEPKKGQTFSMGQGATVTVLAPLSDRYEDMNDYSVVLRLDYYETSFLFTGDAEKTSEMEMIETWTDGKLDCDVLRVGHHGSGTSTNLAFLKLVTPELAVISCGEDNKYGHPHAEVLDRLAPYVGESIYRTDELGSIVFITNGSIFSLKN
jgi:competence protein ComEC